MYKRNIKARSPNHCCRGKAIFITHSEYASVALIIQRTKCMRCIASSPVASPAPPYFSALSQKRCDFRKKKKIEN
jgi:hypothetical protein